MNLQLKDKTALVSGSSQGIGFAIAEALAAEGATVVINSYKLDLVDQAIDKLSKTVRDARLIGAVADLSTEEGVQDLVKKVPAVDVLVNSVGFYVAKDFLEISDKDWLWMSFLKRFVPLPSSNDSSGRRRLPHLWTYLCSPLASATNGAALRVDGGVVASIP